jgi:hypothetical protein
MFMKNIEVRFNISFSHWGIKLPPDDIAERRRGKIMKGGWVIWYLFGSDENGEYLDYYASHRMTDDEHVRIYAGGKSETLPTLRQFRLTSTDPKEDARLEFEFFSENERISKMLKGKGFKLQGDEPSSIRINRMLRSDSC